jgi:hypothetical protein
VGAGDGGAGPWDCKTLEFFLLLIRKAATAIAATTTTTNTMTIRVVPEKNELEDGGVV